MQTDRYSSARTQSQEIDAGLRKHMQSVYNRMTVGVLLTAITAWIVSSSPDIMYMLLGGPQRYIVLFGPLAIIWFGFNPEKMSSKNLMFAFIGISVLYGISFSAYAFMADVGTIARAFFLASAMFAGLSIFGYTTKKDLSALGTFAVMGVMGIFFASIANIFFASPIMSNLIAGIGIVVFAGVTAWQTQQVKSMYNSSYGNEINSRMAWSAALTLYISFLALFQYIMHFMNQR